MIDLETQLRARSISKTNIHRFLKEIKSKLQDELEDGYDGIIISNIKFIDILLFSLNDFYKFSLNELILSIHREIFANVPNIVKEIGSYRSKPVFIGKQGIWNPKQANYVPPPSDLLDGYMKDFEEFYLRTSDNILINTALAMQQILLIHPFENANGRISRILALLKLIQNECFIPELLFLKPAIDENKISYISSLNTIHKNDNLIEWINFFGYYIKYCLNFDLENSYYEYSLL